MLRKYAQSTILLIYFFQFLVFLYLSDVLDIESILENMESDLKAILHNKETLQKTLIELIELQSILQKTHVFLEEVGNSLVKS